MMMTCDGPRDAMKPRINEFLLTLAKKTKLISGCVIALIFLSLFFFNELYYTR